MAWRGKTAFITGGVSGIGFGIARAFSNAGIKLILSYRNEDYREQAERWFVDQRHETPGFVKLDVTDRQRFAEVAEEIGDIHILVNNAGVSVFGPTDEASYADYDWIMGVNFGGTVNGLVSLLPGMKAHGEGGHVVNVASMAAFCAGPQAGIYTASKFAVRGLTESLRFNLAPYNIGVSLMCPGLTNTNAWDSALKRPEGFSESGFAAPDHQELERFGKAFDLGMDPLEVGEKTLRGIVENRGLILTHPDHREDFEEIYRWMVDALPDEPVPEGRAEIERLRREANRTAEAGMRIGLDDLT
ncbi:SDR family NAD(P)-dependent oxidoreductase [Parasphingorhabdus sp.]|uniref:SDR family NAD(P)-dependent oxidoreductase n=1 Tax=Parasphingorhabdus sp. TaxID=2709688 RepID=UPI003001EB7E